MMKIKKKVHPQINRVLVNSFTGQKQKNKNYFTRKNTFLYSNCKFYTIGWI